MAVNQTDISDVTKGKTRPKASKRTLTLVSSLVNEDVEKRIKNAQQLIKWISGPSKKQAGGAADIDYVVGRLVRGLASSRAGARAGLFSTLVVSLRQLSPEELPTQLVLEAAASQLPATVTDSRQRVEHRLGRLLACGALVRAGRLDVPLSELVADLLAAWSVKSYMPALAAPFLVALVQQVEESQFADELWPLLKPLLEGGWEKCSPDTLWILVSCRQRFPAVCDQQYLISCWGSKKLLSTTSFTSMVAVIKSAAKTLPAIHPLLPCLVNTVCVRSKALLAFCASALEPLLRDKTAVPLALAMLQMTVPRLSSPSLVSAVLTPAVVGCLVRLLPKRDRLTENAARGLASALTSHALSEHTDASTQLALVTCLVTHPGSVNIDSVTGTKMLSQLVNGLKAEALEPFADVVVQAFHGSLNGQEQSIRARIAACGVLSRIILHASCPGYTQLKRRLLQLLFNAGAVVSTSCADQLPDGLAAAALRNFYRSLDRPVRRMADLETLLWDLVSHQNTVLSAVDSQLRVELSPAARVAWKQTLALAGVEDSSGPPVAAASQDALVILMLFLCQQLFNADDGGSVVATLQELRSCAERRQRPQSAKSQDAEEPEWRAVVLDILLSLLSQDAHFLRSVVRSVFGYLAPTLSREVLLHFFSVLNPDYKMGADGDDVDDGESEDGDGSEVSSEDEGEDDAESDDDSVSEEEKGGSDDSGIDPENEDDVGLEEDDDEDDPEPEQLDSLKDKLKTALGDAAEDSASDVDMDDVPEEHFARIDAALAETFRALRKDKRTKVKLQTDEEMSLMHFRIRVLDLVEVYVRVCPGTLVCVDLLPVMVSLLAAVYLDSRQSPLVHRLRGCINQLASCGCRALSSDQLTGVYLTEVLDVVLLQGARLPSASLDMGSMLTAAVRVVVRNSIVLDDEQRTLVTDRVLEALKDFFFNRECVFPPRLFGQLLSLPEWRDKWRLVSRLVVAASDRSGAVRSYRRSQAAALLTAVFRNHAALQCVASEHLDAVIHQMWTAFKQTLSVGDGSAESRDKLVCAAFEPVMLACQARQRLGYGGEQRAVVPQQVLSAVLKYQRAAAQPCKQLGKLVKMYGKMGVVDGEVGQNTTGTSLEVVSGNDNTMDMSNLTQSDPTEEHAEPLRRKKLSTNASVKKGDQDGTSHVSSPVKAKKKKKRDKELGLVVGQETVVSSAESRLSGPCPESVGRNNTEVGSTNGAVLPVAKGKKKRKLKEADEAMTEAQQIPAAATEFESKRKWKKTKLSVCGGAPVGTSVGGPRGVSPVAEKRLNKKKTQKVSAN